MKRMAGVCLGCGVFVAAMAGVSVLAQDLSGTNALQPLDPTRGMETTRTEADVHKPLSEEYIWTADAAAATDAKQAYRRLGMMEKIDPHYFRHTFSVSKVPAKATLYIAGPRSVKVWLNGQIAESVESDTSSPLGLHVFATDVAKFLREGKNTIAIEAVRGRGVNGDADSALVRQQTSGQVMVAKIVPAAPSVNGAALMMSGKDWKSSTAAAAGWEKASFDDAGWSAVQSIGGVESSVELFQWNADAGMYAWPGYDGISGYLAHTHIAPRRILAHYAGRGSFNNLDAVTSNEAAGFGVKLPAAVLTNAEAPSMFLDFGRELTGRVEIVSDSDAPAVVTVQMGESEPEALRGPYLGVDQITIPPHGTVHGPKSAFRYAKIRFVGGGPEVRIKSIGVDHIYYPVKYAGSFESSDAELNRIWETGAYTAHLCMQDGVWDASKRDRGRWMGDTDVSGRVIEDIFGDRPLMEDTLDRLMGPTPVNQHVNGIPGYSSFWFTGVADYYRHTGSKEFLQREHDRMVQLLNYIDAEFDERNIYANKTKVWLYVDWSPELNGDTPETRMATTLEFYRAYRDAAWLLREAGDAANADKYEARAAAVKKGADTYLVDPATGTYGTRWQTNAAAVISGAAGPERYGAIWDHVLSNVGHVKYNALIISPYYNYYVIRAMAETGHRKDALEWIRQYWGGMLAEGATSFWEGYDPSWYKDDFHASLQADNMSGYTVSLAHGWSSGPTAWLMEEILGIQPTGAGFSTVDIRPDLVGLDWAKGGEPTPHGMLKVDIRRDVVAVDVPEGVVARVAIPVGSPEAQVMVNGNAQQAISSEGGRRMVVTLQQAGHYALTSK